MPPQSSAIRRADQGLRVLTASTPDEICQELARVGCTREGVHIMQPKAHLHLVRLEQVPLQAAHILKQELLAHGGDAAVHWRTIAGDITQTAVILMGTTAQLQAVCAHLQRQPFGLPGTAQAILDALRATTSPGGALRCGRYTLPWGQKTYVMGIINVTPDSFTGDGVDGEVTAATRQAERMIAEGADILDIGGESTRPGADEVPLDEELRRVIPTVRALAPLGVPISVDTYKSVVAREALAAGATIINDISGLRFDADMAAVAAEAQAPVVVMHILGTPRTMQQQPHYEDLLTEVYGYLQESTAIAEAAGLPRDQVILDPGFGFGKTVAHNLELIRRLREFTSSGQPILLGTSRKSTIGAILGGLPPQERVEGTAATVALGIANGADIVRVHDVKEMVRVARVTDAIVRKADFR